MFVEIFDVRKKQYFSIQTNSYAIVSRKLNEVNKAGSYVETDLISRDEAKLMACFGIFDLLSKELNKRLFSRTLHQKCKMSDWDFDVRNRVCSYGEILQWLWRSIKNICTLEPSDCKNSDTKNRKDRKGLLTEHHCKSFKLSRGYLLEEIKPAVTNTCEFEKRDISKLKWLVVFRTIRILLLGKN